MDRDAALELLNKQHTFPGAFRFRVVVPPARVAETISALVAGAGEEATLGEVEERPSSRGTWVALRVSLHLPEAERVLDVYAVIGQLDYVVTSL